MWSEVIREWFEGQRHNIVNYSEAWSLQLTCRAQRCASLAKPSAYTWQKLILLVSWCSRKAEMDTQSASLNALFGVICWQRCSEDLKKLIPKENWHDQGCLYVLRDENLFLGEQWNVSWSDFASSALHDWHCSQLCTHMRGGCWSCYAGSVKLQGSPLLWGASAPVIRCQIHTFPIQISPRWSPWPQGQGQPAMPGSRLAWSRCLITHHRVWG